MKKVALIRLDKIGDLVATLPVDQLISEDAKRSLQIHWIVNDSVAQIIEAANPARSFWALSGNGSWNRFLNLYKYLKSQKFDESILFYGPWWASFAIWLAGISKRTGRISQWHSVLFLNNGLRQNRSSSSKHEFEYNSELFLHGLSQIGQSENHQPYLSLSVKDSESLLKKWQLEQSKFVVVHPGMAGSARNWPQSHYNILIEKLINQGPVVITGTDGDHTFLSQIEPQWKDHPQIRWTVGQLKFNELLSILKSSKHFYGPSTGVLHLASAVGTKVTGIYSPIKAHSLVRWGARGNNVKNLAPKVDCPAAKKCWGSRCPNFDCMETLKVNSVIGH